MTNLNAHLPILEVALDVGAMTNNLRPLLLCLTHLGHTPAIESARLLDYKPGQRALIHYQVTGTEGEQSDVVFGKLYAELSQALRVFKTMKLLWDDVFSRVVQLGVPQPLGCIPEMSMLFYVPVEGRFLDELIDDGQAAPFMEMAGKWLSTLHAYRLPLEKRFDLATELANLHMWAGVVGQKYPDQAEASAQLSRYLQERANALEFDTHVPIHKDFHYRHIVAVGGELAVIDFDEVRLGDPNFDLAHFCANLRLLAYRNNWSPFQFSMLESAFLSSYAHSTGWTQGERFVYFYVYTCLKLARQLCLMHGPHPRPEEVEEQHRQVRLMLEAGRRLRWK